MTEVLFLLRDPDDTNTDVEPVLRPEVWDLLSEAILEDMLGIPSVRREAQRLGIVPAE